MILNKLEQTETNTKRAAHVNWIQYLCVYVCDSWGVAKPDGVILSRYKAGETRSQRRNSSVKYLWNIPYISLTW